MIRRLFCIVFTCSVFFSNCAQESREKINGLSFVASRLQLAQENITPMIQVNANYAAVIPFGFIRSLETPEIVFNTQRQWFGETKAGAKQYIEVLQKNKMKIMMKPQIWIWRGEFTGFLKMSTEEDWKVLEDSYRNFILTYAELAQDMNVEIFCIGTELEQFIVSRGTYWNDLIVEIKKKYKGKLTYAANWDEYKRVPFWKELDYIGVDGYFPVSESKTPTVEEARSGWQRWKEELKNVSEREKKQILFTEYGYRSVDFAGKEPWKSDRNMTQVNLESQTNLTNAYFDEIHKEDWYAGGFVWKWYINHQEAGGHENVRFTPQNKPAEIVIRTRFKNNK
jgi:hypothetical protein